MNASAKSPCYFDLSVEDAISLLENARRVFVWAPLHPDDKPTWIEVNKPELIVHLSKFGRPFPALRGAVAQTSPPTMTRVRIHSVDSDAVYIG